MTSRSLQGTTVVRLFLALWLAITPTFVWAGSMTLLGVGGGSAAPTYQGPGDVVSGATIFYSCSRVYQASLASTSTSMCDLVDSAAPTVVICTLRGTASGFVDLAGSYCTGSVTPATKCAAATGGVCNISKTYNQVTPGTLDATQTTAASQPKLTFAAVNGLPVMQFVAASNQILTTAGTLTQTQPYTLSGVYNRTSGTSEGELIGITGATVSIGAASTANNAHVNCGGTDLLTTSNAVTDASYHAVQGVCATSAEVLSVDGAEISGSVVASNISNLVRVGRQGSGAFTLNGQLAEIMFYPGAFTSGTGNQTLKMNTNQHGTNGYNF